MTPHAPVPHGPGPDTTWDPTAVVVAFLAEDSDDMPIPDSDEVDFSAVNPQAPFVGEDPHAGARERDEVRA